MPSFWPVLLGDLLWDHHHHLQQALRGLSLCLSQQRNYSQWNHLPWRLQDEDWYLGVHTSASMALYCSAQTNWRSSKEREEAARRVWAGMTTGDRGLHIYKRSNIIKFQIFVLPILGRIFIFFLVDQHLIWFCFCSYSYRELHGISDKCQTGTANSNTLLICPESFVSSSNYLVSVSILFHIRA